MTAESPFSNVSVRFESHIKRKANWRENSNAGNEEQALKKYDFHGYMAFLALKGKYTI